MTITVGVAYRVAPMQAVIGSGKRLRRLKEMDVRLRCQKIYGAVARTVVNDQEAINAEVSMTIQGRRQAENLVTHNQAGPDFTGALWNRYPVKRHG